MKRTLISIAITAAALLCLAACAPQHKKAEPINDGVKTTFQTSNRWRPITDVRADAAMIYGAGGNFEERVQSWRDRGYIAHFMTGIAWGGYQDYFTGKWDGEMHLDEGQVTERGDTIWHGRMVPYIVPSLNYIKYMKEVHVKRVIDAGIDAIFMEEPEFWARGGYSESFKREWQDYYGFEWRPQHESPENTYLANKLKYYLYYRALNEVFTYAKEYGKTKGMDVKCYVPTHSLVNYSQWMIVSPEASLASLPCVDGYIAQVWTGTSREPNYYNGLPKERVFETAYLEYSCMESMTAPTGRKMFFLTDPIEDWPRDWVDYKKNYEATFTAEILFPLVDNFEVMPWPDRIYGGLYRVSATSEETAHIPRHYSTQMQVMVNSLNKMPYSENLIGGTNGITILMGNSLMFQRYPIHQDYTDPQLSNFYGEALPLLKRGVPVKTAHLENLGFKETLEGTKILLMSYSNMKPMDPEAHKYLAKWVKKGGIIIYSGRDNDPFQTVYEWWNQNGNNYAAPADHLFKLMGIPAGAEAGTYNYGKGKVCIIRQDPKEYVLADGGEAPLIEKIEELYDGVLTYKNYFHLERGMYDIASCMDESVTDEPYAIEGTLIDLYDPELPVLPAKVLHPGQQCLLVNLDRVENPEKPQVLAAASREYDEQITENSYSYICKSPINTTNVARVLLPAVPKSVKVDGVEVFDATEWNSFSKTYRVKFENSPDGVKVEFEW